MMEDQAKPDFQKQKAELSREIHRDMVDVMSGRITTKECNRRQREAAKKLKLLEQRLIGRRGGR